MDFLDKVINSASTVATNVIDAWGRVKVASLDAQVQPPPPVPQTTLPFQTSTTNFLALGALVVLVILVLKK